MSVHSDWAKARGNVYRFLSAAFQQPPGPGLVGSLSSDGLMEELEYVFGNGAVDDLRRFVNGFDGNYDNLEQEFQDLFMVPLGRYVTPYESVYRDQRQVGDTMVHGLLMGPSTLAVKQLYRDMGATISEDFRELPDHIALELACMSFLCEQEAYAWERNDSDRAAQVRGFQQRLLHEHLLQWVPALCAKIRENALGPFYSGIAGLTEASLGRDVGN